MSIARNYYNPYNAKALFNKHIMPYLRDYGERVLGYRQYKNAQSSLSAKIDYENYLKAGNYRSLRDWHKNVPGRSIRYPEFSYPGQIYRSNTSIARAGFDYDTTYSNYVGNLASRSTGLYSIPGKLYRNL